MKRIVVELEEDYHKMVKVKAASDGISMKEYIRQLIKKDLESKKE